MVLFVNFWLQDIALLGVSRRWLGNKDAYYHWRKGWLSFMF